VRWSLALEREGAPAERQHHARRGQDGDRGAVDAQDLAQRPGKLEALGPKLRSELQDKLERDFE
jgi:hypothetical protein